jgi:hypothetical protein
MNLSLINWAAVVVAALSSFLVGGIWYSPVMFQKAWMTASNLSQDELKTGNKAKIFGITAIFSLIMAANLAIFLAPPDTTVIWGTAAGALAGIWTFSSIAIVGLFELKSWRWIFINGGYSLVSLTIMGAILGAWR